MFCLANGSECRTLKGGHFDSINCCIWNERQQACPFRSCVCTLSLIPRQLQAPVASSAQRPHLDMPGPSTFVTSVTGLSDQGQSDACATLFTYKCVSIAHPLRAHCSWILQLSFEQELYSGGNDTQIHTWSPALPHQEPEADLPSASGREEQDTWSDDGY